MKLDMEDKKQSAARSEKDTVWNFDDVADAFPQRSKVPLVAQTDLITLHQPHIYH